MGYTFEARSVGVDANEMQLVRMKEVVMKERRARATDVK